MLLALLLPLSATLFIFIANKRENIREAITLLTSLSLIVVVYLLLQKILEGQQVSFVLLEINKELNISFYIEPLGMLFSSIASLLWLANSIYSIAYMRANKEKHHTRFYICFAFAIFSTLGIAFSANLFTLFVFYELLTISTYPLVTHKGSDEAICSGRIYLGNLLTTSVCFFLPAIIVTYLISGSLQFTEGGVITEDIQPEVIFILFILYVYGIGKAALMPVHKWLPAAMVAPTPVSALLHAVAVVKAGVFSIVKISTYIFNIELLRNITDINLLLYIAGFTIIFASFIALRSDNLKRRLAYSTISQLSYVILATALLVPVSMLGAALHILAHAFGKITLFFAAGSIYTSSKKKLVSELDGIGHSMPWTMGAFAVGSISMVGLPPTAGFVSKWYIMQGALSTSSWFAVGVIIASTLLNAAYFFPIIYVAFFRKKNTENIIKEAPLPIVIVLSFTAFISILLFFYPEPIIKLLQPWVVSLS